MSAIKSADHTNWRALFRETMGYKANGKRDQHVYTENSGMTLFDVHLISSCPGEGTIPASIRAFYGQPPRAVVKFRRFLEWCDLKFTKLCLRLGLT